MALFWKITNTSQNSYIKLTFGNHPYIPDDIPEYSRCLQLPDSLCKTISGLRFIVVLRLTYVLIDIFSSNYCFIFLDLKNVPKFFVT